MEYLKLAYEPSLRKVRASASSASYVRDGQHALETEGNDTTSDSKLQSSDSEDDPDYSEDDSQSDLACVENVNE